METISSAKSTISKNLKKLQSFQTISNHYLQFENLTSSIASLLKSGDIKKEDISGIK